MELTQSSCSFQRTEMMIKNWLIRLHNMKPVPQLCESASVSHSVMSDCATPWTVARQAPPSMGFSRQEYWSGLPFPSPGDLPNPGIKPGCFALQADSLLSEPYNLCGWQPFPHSTLILAHSLAQLRLGSQCGTVWTLKTGSVTFWLWFTEQNRTLSETVSSSIE